MHQLLLHWGYLALFVMCVISSAGIPLGTEFAIGYGGALSSGRLIHHVHLQLPLVIAVATLGELCGSLLGYAVGRFGGREFVERFGKYLLVTRSDLDRAEHFFARHGGPIVVFGRLIPVIRSFVSFGPGIAEMPVVRFAGFSALGCAIWCSALAGAGFEFGRSWHYLYREFRYAGYVSLGLFIALVLTVLARRIAAIRRERAIG
jgi:membrane protein DedA with SNARE-associated domain